MIACYSRKAKREMAKENYQQSNSAEYMTASEEDHDGDYGRTNLNY